MKDNIKDIEKKYDEAFIKIVNSEKKRNKHLFLNILLLFLLSVVIISFSIYAIINSNREKKSLQKELLIAVDKTEKIRQFAIELTSLKINEFKTLGDANEELLNLYDPSLLESRKNLYIMFHGRVNHFNSLNSLANKVGLTFYIDSSRIVKQNKYSIFFGDSIRIKELQTVCYLLMRYNVKLDTIIRDSTISNRNILLFPSNRKNSKLLTVENVVDLNSFKGWGVVIGSFKLKSNAENQKEYFQNKIDSLNSDFKVVLYYEKISNLYFLTLGEKISKGDANRILEFAKNTLHVSDAYIKLGEVE